jgi:hypothetical protein
MGLADRFAGAPPAASTPTVRMKHAKLFRSTLWTATFLCAALCAASCTTFTPLDQTGESINRNATSYANNATLLNVVRASLSEPITFITITGLDGTDQAGSSLGLPGITVGPKLPATPRNYFTFGPNSVTRANQNTFHISVVDDPASFTALLTPLNPAMIGFFIRQGYPRELLFFLFIDELREIDDHGNVVAQWTNDPSHNTDTGFGGFIGQMATLLKDGLTAEIDVSNIPTGRAVPLSRLCSDLSLSAPVFAGKPTADHIGVPATLPVDTCASNETDWIQTQGGGAVTAGGSTSPASAPGAGATFTAGHDGSLWVSLGGQNKVARVTYAPDGKLQLSDVVSLPPAPKSPRNGPYVAYTFQHKTMDQTTKAITTTTYQFFMRSTYGVYNYVGALLHHQTGITNLLEADESGYGGISHILKSEEAAHPGALGCFAEVTYRSIRYCVQNASNRTKQVFTLLHELQELNTAPANAPTTLTTVSTPSP